mgnify:FL=1
MKIKTSFFIGLVLLTSFTGYCGGIFGWLFGHQQPPPLGDWFALQKSIAATLNTNWGGSNYIVAPIISDTPLPPGTIYDGVEPRKGCQFPPNIITNIPMNPLPVISSTNAFSANLSLPATFAAAIGLTVGGNILHSNVLYMNYSSLTRDLAYGDDIDKVLNGSTCHDCILGAKNPRVSIVKGQIKAILQISSSSTFDIGADFSKTNIGGISVHYNKSGGFTIQQTNATAWFGFYSDVTVQKVSLPMTSQTVSNTIASLCNPYNRPITEKGSRFALSIDGQTKDVSLMAAELQSGKKLDDKIHTVEFTTFGLTAPTFERAIQLGAISNNPP